MDERFIRTSLLLGETAIEKLSRARVAVFGIGGVGGHLCEALARSGVGAIDLYDGDVVAVSNINRQLVALGSTVGRAKAEVMRDRIIDINPNAEITANCFFLNEETARNIDFESYDYIADAVDDVKAKLLLAKTAFDKNIPIISAMGAGNKLDPTRFEVSDIYKTSVCPLARIMRRELKKLGVTKLKVVYSTEQPQNPPYKIEGEKTVGSAAFVPSVMGLIMAGEIVKCL
ncbi:MAG: tRNA threonylcarbamoyladenosine dehydratase [Ruminococcus sp.]|nr:tRNA threonylcarbamoyladenosine dehydratase [Ruminococcus sp.]